MWLVKTSSINRWSHGRIVPLRLGITLNDWTFACIQTAITHEHCTGCTCMCVKMNAKAGPHPGICRRKIQG